MKNKNIAGEELIATIKIKFAQTVSKNALTLAKNTLRHYILVRTFVRSN